MPRNSSNPISWSTSVGSHNHQLGDRSIDSHIRTYLLKYICPQISSCSLNPRQCQEKDDFLRKRTKSLPKASYKDRKRISYKNTSRVVMRSLDIKIQNVTQEFCSQQYGTLTPPHLTI